MEPKSIRKIAISILAEQADMLEVIAEGEGLRSRADVIREALEEYAHKRGYADYPHYWPTTNEERSALKIRGNVDPENA